MLRHENARTSLRNFIGQWLQVRDLATIPMEVDRIFSREHEPESKKKELSTRLKELRGIDPKSLTPEQKQELDKLRSESERWQRRKRFEFKGPMRESMRKEAEMVVDYMLRENRSLTEFLASDYVFVNQRLASHYDIAGVEGDEMRLVKLPPDSPRGGLLTQAGVLTVTSNPTRTSPVKRGLFILHNILGIPPAPPPPDIPALEPPENRRKTEGTMRDSRAKHRADTQ